jgi:hypothetical protein
VPKNREGCIVHPDGRISDAEFHEPILSGIGPEGEAHIIEIGKAGQVYRKKKSRNCTVDLNRACFAEKVRPLSANPVS